MATYKDRVVKSVTHYQPSPLPLDERDFGLYITNELKRVGDILFNQATFRLERTHVEPVKPRGGDVRYADGSDWNPGGGEGIYLFKEGAEGEPPVWELLAAGADSLEALNDTDINTPSAGQFLKWDGDDWVNAAVPSSGFELTTKGDLLGFDGQTDEEGRVVVGENDEVLVADNTSDFGFGWNKVQTDSIADHAVGADQLSDMSGVEPDEYEAATITVDKQGRITAASSTTLVEKLGDLEDVDTTAVAQNNILKYDSGEDPPWVTVAIPGGVESLADLDDTDIQNIATDDVLKWSGSKWENTDHIKVDTIEAESSDFNELTFNSGGATASKIDADGNLTADSDAFIPTQKAVKAYVDGSSGAVHALNDLSDVTETDEEADQILKYDGAGQWINSSAIKASTLEATSSLKIGGGATVTTIDDDDGLGDSDTKIPTQGAVKGYVDAHTHPSAEKLDDLSDVELSEEATDQLLKYNSSDKWVNSDDIKVNTLEVTGALTGNTGAFTGAVTGASVGASGAVTGTSASLGTIAGTTVAATGAITGASATVVGAVTGASAALGAITGSSATLTGPIVSTGGDSKVNSLVFHQGGSTVYSIDNNTVDEGSPNRLVTQKAVKTYVDDKAGSNTLSGLSDTTITEAASGQFLEWNGSKWVNAAVPGGVESLAQLNDTAISAQVPTDEVLKWNGSKWENTDEIKVATVEATTSLKVANTQMITGISTDVALGDSNSLVSTQNAVKDYVDGKTYGSTTLGGLTDTNITGQADSQVLTWVGGATNKWENKDGVKKLVDLDDVDASGIDEKNILSYNDSGEFVPIKGPPFKWNTI